MAIAYPHLGSFTEYARLGLGPLAGFVSGWLYWYFWVVVVAVEAIAGAAIIALWIPLPQWQIGLALMMVLTAVNLLSARSYGEFEYWFASIKVWAILAFIIVAGSYLFGWGPSNAGGLANLTAYGGLAPLGSVAVLAAVTTVIFSLVGAEIAIIAAAESKEAARTISRLTVTILVRILLFYVLSILLILMIVPWNEITPGVSPFVAALERIGIPAAVPLMNVLVLTAVLSCLNSGVYVTSRVLFALAAQGDAPQSLVALSKSRVPARAILLGSSLGYSVVLTAVISPSVLFTFLLNTSAAIMLIVYMILALAQIRLRRKLEAEDPARLAIKMWWFPYASWLVVAAIAGVLIAMAFTEARATEIYASFFCLAVVVVAYYALRRARPGASGPAAARE
jgi:L-asparagine transporter-like permease